MKTLKLFLACGLVVAGFAAATRHPAARRIGMVIGIKPEKLAAYKALHAGTNPGVRDLLSKYHMRDFSIYLRNLDDGKPYLFAYYEYDGRDYDGDMARLAREQRNIDWLAVTDSMQVPLAGQKTWTQMEEVYHND
jgi:L-rhamnose mutarotase